MPRSTIKLIRLDEELEKWFGGLGLWSEKFEHRIESTRGFIPIDIETQLREQLWLDSSCVDLLHRLLNDSNGLELESLGIKPEDWDQVLSRNDCACTLLVNKCLARTQDNVLLKPLRIAFRPDVQYLVGLHSSF